MKLKIFLPIVFIIFTFFPSFSIAQVDINNKISAIVSIEPQSFFLKQIAGDNINVSVMVQSKSNPATYEPKPNQMLALSKAQVYFAIGVPFEKKWLKKITAFNKDIVIVNTDKGINKIFMKNHKCYENCVNHQIKESNHRYNNEDPHIWTSPPLVKIIAKNIATALIQLNPSKKNFYLNNLKNFEKQIDFLHNEITILMKEDKKKSEFMVFHPSWGYFAKTYGLVQTAVEIEGKAPKAAELVKLTKYARDENIKIIFAQPQFSVTSAKIIAKAIGGKVLFADPLKYDWINNIKNQALQFKMAMQ